MSFSCQGENVDWKRMVSGPSVKILFLSKDINVMHFLISQILVQNGPVPSYFYINIGYYWMQPNRNYINMQKKKETTTKDDTIINTEA